jgi:hypothetical protein
MGLMTRPVIIILGRKFMATCPRPTCSGLIINSKCSKCGAFTYVPTGNQWQQQHRPGGGPKQNIGRTGPAMGTGMYVPPSVMKLHEWKHLTKLKLKRRSDSLRRVDRALKEYETNKGPMKLDKLRLYFDEFVTSKGGLKAKWMNSTRDRNCRNGVSDLAKQLNGEPVTLPREFMEAGMENARLGIIYFFSNLEFQFSDFKLFLEAPADLIGNVSTMGGFTKVVGKNVQGDKKTLSDAIDLGISTGTDIFKTGTILSTDLTNSGLQSAQVNTPHGARLGQIVDQFIKTVWASLIAKFRFSWENAAYWINLGVNVLRTVAKVCVSILADKVAPFISGGLDIIGGVAKIFQGISALIIDKWRGRSVAMLPGHPTAVYDALRRHMSRSMFKGFYEVIKGAAGTAVDAISAGLTAASYGTAVVVTGIAKSIAGLVLSVLELLAKFMFRLVEGLIIKAFTKKAQEHWKNRDDQIAIHLSHDRFNKWYRTNALLVPAIAALTINGGICGDTMRFLQVVNDDGGIVTQSQFNAGCKHIDSLKDYGKELIDESGWRFQSQDPMVKGALTRAGNIEPAGFWSSLESVAYNVFGA